MDEETIERRVFEATKLGSIGSSEWQDYTWKNELAEQKRRIIKSIDEAAIGAETEHNTYHMLERAIGVAAVCMRRLIECKLVTDLFCECELEIHEVRVKKNVEWREPFISCSSGEIFHNYDLTSRLSKMRTPGMIADKMLHARVVGVLSASHYLPDGVLIASDTQRKKHLFHFTPIELSNFFDAFLKDRVTHAEDGFCKSEGELIDSRKVYAIRK